MHEILHTNAFVLSTFSLGEADSLIRLLTEDYGIIFVIAKGVRKKESKLQQSVQQFSLVKVSLIQGRAGWRLTNAIIEKNHFYLLDITTMKVVGRIFSMIERMIPNEEASSTVFQIILDLFEILHIKQNKISKEELENIEIAVLGKIMFELGYVGADDLRLEFKNKLNKIIKYTESNPKKIIMAINNAINESQL